MSDVIRIAIVDDHPALAEGANAILEREPDLEIVAQAGSLAEARALLDDDRRIDVLVLDVRLADGTGLALLDQLDREARTTPAVVVWTGFDIPQYAAYAWRAGARGYVLKTAPVDELVDAVRAVADGRTHFAIDAQVEFGEPVPPGT